MGRNGSFEEQAREEVERIKAQEAAEEKHKQARLRALAEDAREPLPVTVARCFWVRIFLVAPEVVHESVYAQ